MEPLTIVEPAVDFGAAKRVQGELSGEPHDTRKGKSLKFGIGPRHLAELIDSLDFERNKPKVVEDGCGGVYVLGNPESEFENAVVFKPFDEEVATGNLGFMKEFAAYLIDNNMAGVPATGIVVLPLKDPNVSKLGSIQEYVKNSESAADLGPALFRTDDVHRIGVLDLRIVNCDRHSGNMLFSKTQHKLIPIDHGLSFPSALTELGQASFDWLLYPAAKEPFSQKLLAEIEAIDIDKDIKRLDWVGLSIESQLTVRMSTTLLKVAAREGRTLYEIGCMVQRQGDRSKPSDLEILFAKAAQIAKMYKASFMSVFEQCVYAHLNMYN